MRSAGPSTAAPLRRCATASTENTSPRAVASMAAVGVAQEGVAGSSYPGPGAYQGGHGGGAGAAGTGSVHSTTDPPIHHPSPHAVPHSTLVEPSNHLKPESSEVH
eukprot:GHVO01013430.1.p3 GENE.GHVO01013430.1~~GHVO01013430.1.p3  ORF type:complete len:105 (-),score=7.94 GHVO01013430.1:691-1005(-)